LKTAGVVDNKGSDQESEKLAAVSSHEDMEAQGMQG